MGGDAAAAGAGGVVSSMGGGTAKLLEKVNSLVAGSSEQVLVQSAAEGSFMTTLHSFCNELLVELGSGGTKKPRITRGEHFY